MLMLDLCVMYNSQNMSLYDPFSFFCFQNSLSVCLNLSTYGKHNKAVEDKIGKCGADICKVDRIKTNLCTDNVLSFKIFLKAVCL